MKAEATLLGFATQPKHDDEYNWTGAAISAAIEVLVRDTDQQGYHRVGLNIDLSPELLDRLKREGYGKKAEGYFMKRVVNLMKAIDQKYEGTTADTYYIYGILMYNMPILIKKSIDRAYYSANLRTGEVVEYGIDEIDYIKQ